MKYWEQKIPHQVLNLKNVQEGCTELVFRIPACFRHVYSQLTAKQMQCLKENAFIEIKIGQKVLLKVILINCFPVQLAVLLNNVYL